MIAMNDPISTILDGRGSIVVQKVLRSGQARNYAPHETETLWTMFAPGYARKGEPLPLRQYDGRILMQEVERAMSYLPRERTGSSMEEHFRTILAVIEFTDETETVVRTVTNAPYCD